VPNKMLGGLGMVGLGWEAGRRQAGFVLMCTCT
jgi:hypothetical protein